MQQLIIAGGGFAGVWAALAAAELRERASATNKLAITLISRDPWLTIRPRLYESDLSAVRVPLDDVLAPAGIERLEGTVEEIDHRARRIRVVGSTVLRTLRFDGLILAAGSRLWRPPIPGIELARTVDTYAEAAALHGHLESLPASPTIPMDIRYRAIVIGAGFTGIEVATSLVSQLRNLAGREHAQNVVRVIVVERAEHVAPDLGDVARRHVERAFVDLGIEVRTARRVTEVRGGGVLLDSGEWIGAATTIWTGGFRASDLTEQIPGERDEFGRLAVGPTLAVRGSESIFAAGDVAHAIADGPPPRIAPMSCQCAIPMGQMAGHNAAAQILGMPPLPYAHPHYVTCLDLGDAGALFMEGWNRETRLTGFWAKMLKNEINRRLIYPPRPGHVSRLDHSMHAA